MVWAVSRGCATVPLSSARDVFVAHIMFLSNNNTSRCLGGIPVGSLARRKNTLQRERGRERAVSLSRFHCCLSLCISINRALHQCGCLDLSYRIYLFIAFFLSFFVVRDLDHVWILAPATSSLFFRFGKIESPPQTPTSPPHCSCLEELYTSMKAQELEK